MTAKFGVLKSAPYPLPPGAPNCGWLNKLKNSLRKSSRIPSRMAKCLITEKSVFTNRGPESGVRFEFPSCPAAGCAKHCGLNHSAKVGLLNVGLHVWSGRISDCALAFSKPAPDELLLSTTKIGKPDVTFWITVI